MAKPIKIIVRGADSRGDDAPTVEDLLAQIQDFVAVLHSVESAVADDGKEEIVWRVTDATKNSPITFEVTPYPKTHAMNIDRRAIEVVTATAKGFEQIATTGGRPMYFSDQVIDRAERVYARVTNGLAETNVDFSAYDAAPNLEVTRNNAKSSITRIEELRSPPPNTHREIGSLEGFVAKVELDGFERPIVWLRSRLDGQLVKCEASDGGLDRIGHFEVIEVLKGKRVRVHGILHYKSLEQIAYIEVEGVHVFEADVELADADSIVSPGFTGGIESSAYLEALRQDG
ncbi:hypothetical protein [Roseobacter sp. HKCCA0434]|uniref:hypothetical protein n=1 Tax=Roseobacter sp. HKCCA0434 TaxID=3079297 RepID=UPI002905AF9A|nr:hypothetical protein [Roseobacter sp. HKCCA0434]